MRKIDRNILFLSGIILICFGFLLFHINPYYSPDEQEFNLKIMVFLNSLIWRPVGTLGVLSGIVLVFNSLKK